MPGIAAYYRIGPSDLFTTDDLLADANTLNGQIDLLDNQNWDKPSQSLFDAWTAFVSEWIKFYRGTFVTNWFGAGWNDSNRDQLIQFESRFATFASQYAAESGNQLPGGVVAPSTGSKDTLGAHLLNQLQPLLPTVPALALGVGVVILVVIAGLWVYVKLIRPRVVLGGA